MKMTTTTTEMILTFLVAIIWLMSVAGNLLLLRILLNSGERAKLCLPFESSWLHLLSVSLTDLVALFLGLPFTTYFLIFDSWDSGLVACNLSAFVKSVSVTISLYCIISLLMQCYELAVKTSRSRTSPLKQYLLLGSIWALALLISAPLLFSHKMGTVYAVQSPPDEDLELMYVSKNELNQTLGKANGTFEPRHFCYLSTEYLPFDLDYTFLQVMQLFVPLLLIVFLFIKVADSLSKKSAKSQANSNSSSGPPTSLSVEEQLQRLTPNNVKFVQLILTLSVLYCLPWILGGIVNRYTESSKSYKMFFTILQESVFFIKPFILFGVSSNFQHVLWTFGVANTDVEDLDGHQVGFSKMNDEEGQY